MFNASQSRNDYLRRFSYFLRDDNSRGLQVFYLDLPATEGHLANHVKEAILSRMYDKDVGYLAAARECNVSRARAQAELEADTVFAGKVNAARVNLSEVWRETMDRLIKLLEAADTKQTVGIKLKVETLLKVLSKEHPKFKDESGKHEVNVGVAVGLVVDEAKRQELIEQRQRLMATQTDNKSNVAVNVDRFRPILEGDDNSL